eukprot:TRINITY_DN28093_c0_g1_i1.p1 TRINITY_DN28093_c0_g1~~TRINITY_DN28093_c0_g1_i1.p1  ORF type:complete len:282 (+),score=79.34 TRINITY_DN28093_c0_g1_i1:53-847(+)
MADESLRGASVAVTGGASNIALACCIALARAGARVAVLDIDEAGAKEAAVRCTEAGADRSIGVCCDVTKLASVEKAVAAVEAAHGPIAVWVNGAGWVRDQLFLRKPFSDFEREISVNLWGVIHAARAVLPGMVARGKGTVVTIASDAGRVGEYKEAVYSAAKAGSIAFTKALAKEYGPKGVRLNVVCPGVTVPRPDEMGGQSMWQGSLAKTFTPEVQQKVAQKYPLRRLGTSQDCAEAVLFLASARSSFITGQTLSVSGGYSML